MKTAFLAVVSLAACAHAAQMNVEGKITRLDGTAIPGAAAVLIDAAGTVHATATADRDGHFQLRTPGPGLFLLRSGGPGYSWKQALLVAGSAEERVSVHVQLGTPKYNADFANLLLRGDSPRSPLHGKTLVRQPDGTYTVEVETTERELLFAISDVAQGNQLITAPGVGESRLVGGFTFYSIARPADGRVRVLFDPARLPRAEGTSVLRFDDASSPLARLNEAYADILRWIQARGQLLQQQVAAGQQLNAKSAAPLPPKAWLDRVVASIEQEHSAIVRHTWLLQYLAMTLPARAADPKLIKRALDELTPGSSLWQIGPYEAGWSLALMEADEQYLSYGLRIAGAIEDRQLRAYILADVIAALLGEGNRKLAQPLVDRLRTDSADVRRAKAIITRFDESSRVKRGKAAPKFEAASIENPQILYSNDTFRDKVLLLDFWATLCAPCIREIPFMQSAYDKFHERGFEILSYSADASREIVAEFRKERYPMPWLHAIDRELREGKSPIFTDFDAFGFPTSVLIDGRSGNVLAANDDLRGEKLEATLERHFAAHDRQFGKSAVRETSASWDLPDSVKVSVNIPYDDHAETVLDVLQPRAMAAGLRPGAVLFHGGGYDHGHRAEDYQKVFASFLLKRGFVVVNVGYRLAAAAPAPAAVQDGLRAVRWFADNASQFGVDPTRIITMGASSGGHLALLVGMLPRDSGLGPYTKIAAVVDLFGPTNVMNSAAGASVIRSRWRGWIKDDATAKMLSPLNYVRKDLPPIVVIHGDQDQVSPYDQSLIFTSRLKDEGAKYEFFTMIGAGHERPQEGTTLWEQIAGWISGFLTKSGVERQ